MSMFDDVLYWIWAEFFLDSEVTIYRTQGGTSEFDSRSATLDPLRTSYSVLILLELMKN